MDLLLTPFRIIAPILFQSMFFSLYGQQVQCSLRKNADSSYTGSCLYKDSLLFSLYLRSPKDAEAGVWKGRSSKQSAAFNDPIFLEIRGEGGTLATVYRSSGGLPCGWYDIADIETTKAELRFTFNLQALSSANKTDILILQKAKTYLSDSTKWNRLDNRVSGNGDCNSLPDKKTIFCALYAAQTDILGDFYGGPSFWSLIQAIQQSGSYQHPLQAFNNDLKTSFDMLHTMFDNAIGRASESLRSKQRKAKSF